MVSQERFEELASEALDGLPAWVLEAIDNVQVVVEDAAARPISRTCWGSITACRC